ncbi:MAG: ABC transporter permease subunit, partial [bacterium]
MIAALIRKELLDNFLSFRFHVSLVIVIFLMLLSMMVMKQDYEARLATWRENTEAYSQDAREKNSYLMLMFSGVGVDRPPEHLELLYTGVEKNPNRKANIWPFFKPEFTGELNVNPVFPLFPAVDFIFVVSIVMSLLAFVFTYNAVSGEREMGTLKLLMSYSIPRDRVILAKWIGGYVSLVIPFLIGTVICSLVILVSLKLHFNAQDWGAFALATFASLLFIGVMYSTGLFVSIICRTSATSISVLLLIWVIFVLVIPNAAPFLIDQTRPIPSVSEVMSRIKYKSGGTINKVIDETITSFGEAIGVDLKEVDFRGEEGAAEERAPQPQQQPARQPETTTTAAARQQPPDTQLPEGMDASIINQIAGEITDDDLREIQIVGCESFIDGKLKEKTGMSLDQAKSLYPD